MEYTSCPLPIRPSILLFSLLFIKVIKYNILGVYALLTPKQTRGPAVARIADRTGFQWPSRSSKVDDFHYI